MSVPLSGSATSDSNVKQCFGKRCQRAFAFICDVLDMSFIIISHRQCRGDGCAVAGSGGDGVDGESERGDAKNKVYHRFRHKILPAAEAPQVCNKRHSEAATEGAEVQATVFFADINC